MMKNDIVRKRLLYFSVTVAIQAFAVLLSHLFESAGVSKNSVIMIFLLGVVFTTVLTAGYVFGLISAILGVILFNYFFTAPRLTLAISSSNDLILLFFFLITAITSGTITSKLRKQTEISAENEKTAQLLSVISVGFLHLSGTKEIILRGIDYIREYTGLASTVTLSDGTEYSCSSFSELKNPQFLGEYPVQSASGEIGVMRVYGDGDIAANEKSELVFRSVATQMGIALDREQAYSEKENIRIAMERERLRSTLLRAVAHDLRSPLTALSGASALLAESFDSLTEDEKRKLAGDISEEIVWLTNLVENTLYMTRIRESQLVLSKIPEVIDDVVSGAVSHMGNILRGRRFSAVLPDEVVSLPMDGKLIMQVLINLLDNAVKHTPPEAEISLRVETDGSNAVFTVSDTGGGIDSRIRDTLFESFVTVDRHVTDGKRGMGLGLTICKAIVEAHGGRISAGDNIPHGAVFSFTLPLS